MAAAPDIELLVRLHRRGIPLSLPASIRQGLRFADDEYSNNRTLTEQLEEDAWLQFGMLALGNLPVVARRRRFESIGELVSLLGRTRCVALLWALAACNLFRAWPVENRAARERLWRHSLLTGVVTQALLAATGNEQLGRGLAAGLVHDLGHLTLAMPAPPRLGIVSDFETDALTEVQPSSSPERDHCRIGAALLELWDAPEELIAAAEFHHVPAQAPPAVRPLVAAVRLADLLAEHLDPTRPPQLLNLELSPAWQDVAAIEPWPLATALHRTAVARLVDSKEWADRLAGLLGEWGNTC